VLAQKTRGGILREDGRNNDWKREFERRHPESKGGKKKSGRRGQIGGGREREKGGGMHEKREIADRSLAFTRKRGMGAFGSRERDVNFIDKGEKRKKGGGCAFRHISERRRGKKKLKTAKATKGKGFPRGGVICHHYQREKGGSLTWKKRGEEENYHHFSEQEEGEYPNAVVFCPMKKGKGNLPNPVTAGESQRKKKKQQQRLMTKGSGGVFPRPKKKDCLKKKGLGGWLFSIGKKSAPYGYKRGRSSHLAQKDSQGTKWRFKSRLLSRNPRKRKL